MCINHNNLPAVDMIMMAVLSVSFFSVGLAIAEPIYFNDLFELNPGHQKNPNKEPDSARLEDSYRQGDPPFQTPIPVPEPSTLLLVGEGIAGGSVAEEKTKQC